MFALRECGLWIRSGFHVVRRAPGLVCIGAGLGWLWWPLTLAPAVLVLTLASVLRAWAVLRPASFSRFTGPLMARWWQWRVLAAWPELTDHCKLAPGDAPKVRRSQVSWPHVGLTVRPAPGQTAQHFQDASEALRLAVGASRLRVEPEGVRDIRLTFTVGDELRAPFSAAPGRSKDDGLRRVTVGRTERGEPWRVPVGPHTLVAGCSGSGKGSVFWSFAFALAPAVRDGLVQLHGVDLKGGMEILMGRDLFTTTATDPAQAVMSLERLVAEMSDRNRKYAGRVRSHRATPGDPLHVVMIDELAALTAYCSDRELQRRAETAINLLCSQGRAPGFMVFACLQDPRKEVIPSRGLFTQMIGLRLKDQSETAMVLGEGAVQSGAHCHRITRDVPGTGYVVPEDGGPPLRVRAGYASDEAIRAVAERYATPTKVELEVPPADDPWWQSGRRRRPTEVQG